MKTILLGLVFISPPFLKVLLLRWLRGAAIARGARIGWLAAIEARRIELGAGAVVRPLTLIRLDGDFRLGADSEVSSFCLVYGSAGLRVGSRSYIGPQSLINADEEVQIGDNSALGPRSMVFTHGSFLPYNEGYWARLAGVTLGDYVWCAAGVFLHPGVEIGDDSFVNSCAVVTGAVPPGSVVEGNPGRVVSAIDRLKRRMTPARRDVAFEHILEEFARLALRRKLGIAEVAGDRGWLRFVWRGTPYEIRLIPSAEQPSEGIAGGASSIYLYLSNRPGWHPPRPAQVFDLVNMSTTRPRGAISRELRLFMLRYFGVRFTISS